MACLETKDLCLTRGASTKLCLTDRDSDCETIDLTGQAIYLTVRENENSEDVLISKTSLDPTQIVILEQTTDQGKFEVYFTPGDTSLLSSGCYVYDIWREKTTGEQIPLIASSKFLVKQGVTNIGAVGSPPSVMFPEPVCLRVVGPITSAYAINVLDDVVKANVSEGAFNVVLPPHPLECPQGKKIVVRELSGTVGLSVLPASPDLLEGSTAAVVVPEGGALTFVSDGANWTISSAYNPNVPEIDLTAITFDDLITEFVYEPGGTGAGPVTFSDWAAMYAAMQDNRALAGGLVPMTVTIDDRIVSPAIVPAGTYEMGNVTLSGITRPGGFGATEARIGDGVIWQNGPRIFNSIRLQNTSNTTSPMVVANAETILVQAFSDLSSTGTTGMFDTRALPAGSFYTASFIDGAFVGSAGGTGGVFDLGDNTILLIQGFHGRLNRHTVKGGPGSGIFQQVSAGWQYTTNQQDFSGFAFLEDFTFQPPRIKVDPTVRTGSTTLTSQDGFAMADASGGVTRVRLPNMDNQDNVRGRVVIIKEVSGTAGLTVDTFDGELINGSSVYTFASGNKAITFVALGVGNGWQSVGD